MSRFREEVTSNPIFLLQKRVYVLTNLPSWLDCEDGYLVFSSDLSDVPDDCKVSSFYSHGEIDEKLLYEYLLKYQQSMDAAYVVEKYETERVFFSREEAESWAQARHYNYQFGWQIYCVPCEGELARILKQTEGAAA